VKQTKPEVFTKEYAMRIRLQRDLSAPFKKDEYGDYDKYEKNTVEEKNDTGKDDYGNDTFYTNYNNMLR